MKATFICAAALAVLPDAVPALHLPAFLEPRQQQGPRCSLYSDFKDSPSFTSLCRQLPRATKQATYTLQSTASSSDTYLGSAGSSSTTSSSSRWIPSISGEHFTFDGGQTSTVSPVDPAISSAANHRTYEMQNYTITTTGPLSSDTVASTSSIAQTSSSIGLASGDVEVNCYLNGSNIPMSECTRTEGLTRHHGYTYTPSSRSATATTTSSSSGSVSSVKSSSSVAGPTQSSSTNSPSSKGLDTTVSGVASSTICTRTMNLTRHHGYTFSDTLTRERPTAGSISSSVASSPAASTSSSEANLSFDSADISSSTLLASSTTLPGAVTSTGFYTNSYDCSNATNPEPHRKTSSAPEEPTTETPSLVTVSKTASSSSSIISSSSSASSSIANTFSTSFNNSYDCNNITAAEPHRKAGSIAMESLKSACSAPDQSHPASEPQTTAFEPVGVNAKFQQTSTTTVVDATVTEVIPCPIDVQTKEKRDAIFIRAAGERLCDAGVYCVNSTFVSDAPPSWQWETVALRQGQICLEDNVFNTAWVEQQCACAGL